MTLLVQTREMLDAAFDLVLRVGHQGRALLKHHPGDLSLVQLPYDSVPGSSAIALELMSDKTTRLKYFVAADSTFNVSRRGGTLYTMQALSSLTKNAVEIAHVVVH